ncbi:MAG TPA: DUF4349 domain-containing protein [Candidatus Sulfomarinibacteraceae bacterium]|nr:DUF4349 domain-containing protein [Candidatus Sulfomarinibacteraceae bacterium]
MLHNKPWALLLVLALIIAGCANAQEAGEPAFSVSSADMEAPMEAEGERAFSEEVLEGAGQRSSANAAQPGETQERLIIRTGEISIVVEHTEETIDAITDLANSSGGWVVSSNVYQRNQAKAGDITIRVPVEQFEVIKNQIEAMALEVTGSSSSGDDVTEEYFDLSARLENLEATADRVRTFLDEAQDVEEALAVNAELSRLEGDIESLKGRIQYLEQSAAYSTLTVRITPDELSQPLEVGGWRPTGVVRDAVQALVSALQGLASLAIWLVIVALPLALIVILPIWLVVTLFRRWRRGRREAVEPTPET